VIEPASAIRNSVIARVTVEPADANTTRVRLALTEPVAHHVRSERSAVIVDLGRVVPAATAIAVAPVARAASLQVLSDLSSAAAQAPAPAAPAQTPPQVPPDTVSGREGRT
jgi:hypothetical protein